MRLDYNLAKKKIQQISKILANVTQLPVGNLVAPR